MKYYRALCVMVPKSGKLDFETFLTDCPPSPAEIKDENECIKYVFYPPRNSYKRFVERLKSSKFKFDRKKIKHKDWCHEWKKTWTAFEIEGFKIVPTWEDTTDEDDRTVIRLSPGMAFGTGIHFTTYSCITLMKKYFKPDDSFLDVGTGSGILSICADKLGGSFIYSFDKNSDSVKTAKKNLNINESSAGIFCSSMLCFEKDLKFDVITVNILWNEIKKYLREGITEYLDEKGIIILSGLLKSQRSSIIDTLKSYPLRCIDEMDDEEWLTLLLEKNE